MINLFFKMQSLLKRRIKLRFGVRLCSNNNITKIHDQIRIINNELKLITLHLNNIEKSIAYPKHTNKYGNILCICFWIAVIMLFITLP